MKEDNIMKSLPVPLNDEEKLKLGEELALLECKMTEASAKKKQCDQEFTDEINGYKGEIFTLSKQLNSGNKYEDVECYWTDDGLDPPHFKKLYRVDTGEEISSVPCNDDQMNLPL